jgi:hypothetical protein
MLNFQILSRARLPVPPHGQALPSISEGRRAGQKENLWSTASLRSGSQAIKAATRSVVNVLIVEAGLLLP